LTLSVIGNIGCAGPTPPPSVRAFADRVLALDQSVGFGSATSLDGSRLLTARHVLPAALQRSDTVRIGSRTFDLTRGLYRGSLAGEDIRILALGLGRPRHAVQTDWAVLAPHPPTLPDTPLPRFAHPPPVGARVWVIGYPESLGGTEPDAKPTILAATVMAPLMSINGALDDETGTPVNLAGSFAARFVGSLPDLSGMSGGPVLWVAADGSIAVVGVTSHQASREELLGLRVRRWVFVCPVPEQIGALLIAPIPEPIDLPALKIRGPIGTLTPGGPVP
jgi:hypothetical protein